MIIHFLAMHTYKFEEGAIKQVFSNEASHNYTYESILTIMREQEVLKTIKLTMYNIHLILQ